MREVAVTEGDKVAAQMQFGYSVNGYGVGDLVKCVNAATDWEIERLIRNTRPDYTVAPELRKNGKHAGIPARGGPD